MRFFFFFFYKILCGIILNLQIADGTREAPLLGSAGGQAQHRCLIYQVLVNFHCQWLRGECSRPEATLLSGERRQNQTICIILFFLIFFWLKKKKKYMKYIQKGTGKYGTDKGKIH